MRIAFDFAGFGRTVTLHGPQLNGIPVPPQGTMTTRFGHGRNENIHIGTVAVVHDAPAGGGRPTIALNHCR